MRLIEILIPATLAVYIFLSIFLKTDTFRLIHFLPVLSIILVILHLVIEKYRWQMIPLYLITAIILLIALPEMVQQSSLWKGGLTMTKAGSGVTLILLAIATILPGLLPVPALPAPGGPFSVGTQVLVLTDDSRPELYSVQDKQRKFMIRVWYPAIPEPSNQRAPWMDHATVYGRAISEYLSLPRFFLDHLSLSKSPAWMDAPIRPTDSGYPIVIFSHGWNGFAAQNTGQALELASRGYVVVALQHTYGAVVTVFPDGEVAFNNPDALPEGMPEPGYTEAARILANQWSQDIAITLDYLTDQKQNSSSLFYSKLDLSRVGVYGHSTGGGAAIQFCGIDPRCKAVLGMDPFLTPVSEQILELGVPQPAFFMFSQVWVNDTDSKNNRLFYQFISHLNHAAPVIGIQGTTHYDFSDLPMLSPIASQLRLKGPIDGERVTEIVDSYLVAFFESALQDKAFNPPGGPSGYPEVIEIQ